MPVREFAGDATIRIRDGQGAETSSFALPFSDGRVIAKPKRPDGPAFRELVDGRRKERRAEGFYLDVDLGWGELSKDAHATLVDLVDALHLRSGTETVHFSPETGIDEWRVVPALSGGDIDLIYEKRVRGRTSSLKLKAREATTPLPGWLR